MKQLNTLSSHGFTLIELAIYGGLLGILLLIMSQFFVATMELKTVTDNETAIQSDGRYMLDRLAYDIKRASSITLPSTGQMGSTLSAVIRENSTDVPYRYSISGTDLMIQAGTESALLNSTGSRVTGFTVRRYGNSASIAGAKDTLQIQLSLEGSATTAAGRDSQIFTTSIGLR